MPLPTSYSWPIIPPTASIPPPPFNPGPVVNSLPSFQNAKSKQFAKGIRFANVPGGRSDNALSYVKGTVFHVSTVVVPRISHADNWHDKSGVIQNRRRANFKGVPKKVNAPDPYSNDRFGNPVFFGTGVYPPGFVFAQIDSGIWNIAPAQNVIIPRSSYVGLKLLDGRAVILGGIDGNGNPLSQVEVYASASGVWAQPFSSMPTSKTLHAGAVLNSGDMLVVGGSGSALSEPTASARFAVGALSWISTLVGTVVPRSDFQVITLADGRVLAPGGTGLVSGSAALPFTGSELFIPNGMGGVYSNPANDYWTGSVSIPLYPFNRTGYTLTPLLDGTVLLLGGRDPLTKQNYSHALRYVPSNFNLPGSQGTWIVENSMSFARSGHSTVLLDDGKILVAGGSGDYGSNLPGGVLPMQIALQPGNPAATNQAEIFDPGPAVQPDTGWSGSISTQLGFMTASNGTIYSTGSFVYSSPLVYGKGLWKSAGQMRAARSYFAMVPLRRDGHEGRVLAVGGIDGTTYLSSSEIFEYEFKTWTTLASAQRPSAKNTIFTISPSTPYIFLLPSGETTGTLPNALSGSQQFQTNG